MSWSAHAFPHFAHTSGQSTAWLSTSQVGVKLWLTPVQPEEEFDPS